MTLAPAPPEPQAPGALAFPAVGATGALLGVFLSQAIATQAVQGDFNNSGTVNNANLAIIRTNFATGTTKAQGDANADSLVDGTDFLTWQRQLGKTPSEGDSWDEAGPSDNIKFSEAFLGGATTIAPGSQVSLGHAFNTSVFGAGVNGNLTFRYGIPGQGTLSVGDVQYVTSGPITAVPEPTSLLRATWLCSSFFHEPAAT